MVLGQMGLDYIQIWAFPIVPFPENILSFYTLLAETIEIYLFIQFSLSYRRHLQLITNTKLWTRLISNSKNSLNTDFMELHTNWSLPTNLYIQNLFHLDLILDLFDLENVASKPKSGLTELWVRGDCFDVFGSYYWLI